MTDLIDIHGVCAPGFEAVREAFAANFTDAPEGLDEQAARFSVVIEEETVVDLWGGWADTAKTTPFTNTTLTSVFSTGKAVMALLMATAVEAGQVDYDQTVASLWPAFGAAGKEDVTVAQLLSHQSGLPGFSEAVEPSIWFDAQAVVEKLAAQAPMWAPGTASGYHPITVGYLANAVFRRATGRTMGHTLREDFANLDLWIGLPDSEHGRVAQMRKPTAAPSLGTIDPIKQAAFLDRGSAPGGRGSVEWRRMEIPSANLHGTALGLAKLLGVVANEGRLNGRSILSGQTLEQLTRERIHGQDKVLPYVISWAAGLMRNDGLNVFGPNAAWGHYGWGGSMAMADPSQRLSAAYVMTRQSPHLIGDPRPRRLLEAVYAAL
ncbi:MULTISPECIES: serine hydrolase domain-containing protein [unclassified Brevundimonas]|uniref:serine hydrolase domain-containing protein n=1 Tax=unclassified Brevundimonas TaxID=2622653 RepID=UPI000E89B16B|nr:MULTISPECIES: serine hydrolase domain-containing protein [unclassified Brevundimonas]MCK6105846.1 beta-lactamase family protein [Brevundimonas sp. EYE_349]HBI18013.1 esterase [Brevundimonas sp.]